MKNKKTYSDLVNFIMTRPHTMWESVRHDALQAGFTKRQVRKYERRWYRATHKTVSWRKVLRAFGRGIWAGAVIVGAFLIAHDLRSVMRSAYRRNNLQAAAAFIYGCKAVPEMCDKLSNLL